MKGSGTLFDSAITTIFVTTVLEEEWGEETEE
jgi:hypothetical protein